MSDSTSEIKNKVINVDNAYALLDQYFSQEWVMYQHQHKSFDQFLGEYIPNFLERGNHVFYEQVTKDTVYRYKFIFDNVRVKAPMKDGDENLMFPHDARQEGLTYSSKIIVRVKQIQEVIDVIDGSIKTNVIGNVENDVPIAKIPIMVRSKYCNTTTNKTHESALLECDKDPGAHFIVNGSEKVIMSLEKMKPNHPLVFEKKEQSHKIMMVQIHSQNYQTSSNMQIFSIKMKKDNTLVLNISQFNECSIFIFLRAMGLEADEDIINYVVADKNDKSMINQLRVCLELSKVTKSKDHPQILTQEDAILYMMNKMKTTQKYSESTPEIKLKQKRMHLMKILTQDILPHMGTELKKKAYYICYMINKLLACKMKRTKIDDRDSFINKRVDLPGPLLALLFQQNFKKMMGDCRRQFDSRGNSDPLHPPNIISQIKPNFIEQGIRSSLSTGSWGGSKARKGVAQTLPRLSYAQTTSTLRKIVSPSVDASTNKMISPRQLHGSQDGNTCPCETPEGGKTGLIKNLTLSASVTLMYEEQIVILKDLIIPYVKDLGTLSPKDTKRYVKVFLNGEWLGITTEPIKVITELKEHRFKGTIEKTVSFFLMTRQKELHVYCDAGRLYRPLLVVENDKLNYTTKMVPEIKNMKSWNEVMTAYPRIVEFIDTEELHWKMLAIYPQDVVDNYDIKYNGKVPEKQEAMINRYDANKYHKYTHCEIHPSIKFGVVASSIPFSNHNQSPRNIYQYSQAKQAMGIYSTAYRHRMTDISYILYYSQVPIIATRAIKYTSQDVMTAGENLFIMIGSYSGYNMEDSIIVNQSAVDRGLLRATAFKKYKDEIKSNQSTSQHDVFTRPTEETVQIKKGNYGKVGVKGYAPEETKLDSGDAIIGKISPVAITESKGKQWKDNSTFYKAGIPGVVDKVIDSIKTNEGYDQIMMKIRAERIPVVGDKASSRAGPFWLVLTYKG